MTELLPALDILGRAFDYYAEVGDVDQAVAVAECPDYGVVLSSTGMAQLIARALTMIPPDSHHAGRLLAQYGMIISLQAENYKDAQEAFGRALVIAKCEDDIALEMWTLA